MKNNNKVKGYVLGLFGLAFVLCVWVFLAGGCGSWAQPGETEAEGQRRHMRNLAINQQEMMADIDKVLLFDKPSTLSDKRIR